MSIELQAVFYVMLCILLVVIGFSIHGTKKYLVKYIEKKADNLATKEDIATITKLTEETKTEVHRHSIIKEKWWDLKKEVYLNLIHALDQIQQELLNAIRVVKNKGNNVPADTIKPLMEKLGSGVNLFRNALSVSGLVLNEQAKNSLELYRENVIILLKIDSSSISSYENLVKITADKYEEIISIAKNDLQFNEDEKP